MSSLPKKWTCTHLQKISVFNSPNPFHSSLLQVRDQCARSGQCQDTPRYCAALESWTVLLALLRPNCLCCLATLPFINHFHLHHSFQVLWNLVVLVPLEKRMATHSGILAWRIPWTEDSGKLQSMESQRVEHDQETNYSPWSHRESNMTKQLTTVHEVTESWTWPSD